MSRVVLHLFPSCPHCLFIIAKKICFFWDAKSILLWEHPRVEASLVISAQALQDHFRGQRAAKVFGLSHQTLFSFIQKCQHNLQIKANVSANVFLTQSCPCWLLKQRIQVVNWVCCCRSVLPSGSINWKSANMKSIIIDQMFGQIHLTQTFWWYGWSRWMKRRATMVEQRGRQLSSQLLRWGKNPNPSHGSSSHGYKRTLSTCQCYPFLSSQNGSRSLVKFTDSNTAQAAKYSLECSLTLKPEGRTDILTRPDHFSRVSSSSLSRTFPETGWLS